MSGAGHGDLLDRWLVAVLATPSLTALRDPAEARRVLLDDALRAVPLVAAEKGPLVDVGSGGGTPGIPLAAALPHLEVTLLEAERRKCDFLEAWTAELPSSRNTRLASKLSTSRPTMTHSSTRRCASSPANFGTGLRIII